MSLHSLVRPFAGVLLAALAPVLAGCAEDDFDREAAYPQTIGVTNPRPSPAVQVAQSTTPAVQQPAQPAPPPPPPQGYDEDGAPIATAPPAGPAGEDYADTDPSALTDFRSTLDPYGSWVDDPTYGTVWVPSSDVVGSDFSPYVTAGHWNYDDDYTWVSDYDWGWAPFHYGRWAYAAPYGWEWIPGRVYAGAWVSWRYGWGDWGYVGWAPLGPTWGWRGGTAYGLGFVGAAPYSFCATGDLFSEHVGPHVLAGGQVATIGAHTQPWGTPANPTVNGRTPATPHVNGPPPQVLHIPQSAVAHGAINNRGVMQAQAFAHASTAGVMGARPPQGQGFATRAPYASPYASRVPSYGSPGTSHFGGRLGSGFRGDIASARPTYGPTYGPTRPGSGSSGYIGSRSGWTGYSGARSGFSGYGGGYSGARSGWTPSYGGVRGGWGGGGTSFGVAPGVHPGTASHPGGSGQSSGEGGYSGGGYHGGGGSHGGGGFTGGGSFGGGGFGGGGFRGGGGGGGGRGGGGHR